MLSQTVYDLNSSPTRKFVSFSSPESNYPSDTSQSVHYISDSRITSDQNPYKIIDIAHIVSDTHNPKIKGRLSLSISPGKKDKRWNRDLNTDLESIKHNGIQIIVCLLEWGEMKMLNIENYPLKAQEQGFLFYHLPVKDMCAPTLKELSSLVPILVQHLVSGQNILIHCRGGLGRAGTLCACCLTHFGYNCQSAIDTVRSRRPGAIQNKKQETCISQYCYCLPK